MKQPTDPESIAVLSGGLDSSVSTALANKKHKVGLALTFNYNQISYEQEKTASSYIASFLGIPHRTMKLGIYDEIYHKMLDTNLSEKPSDYWIPNRNALFINICAVIAEYRGFKYIVVGFNRDEAENFPDNTQEFLDAINNSLRYSTNNQVSVISPTCELTKTEIVQIALDLNLPLNRIYSCYKGVSPMCGECPSCVLFKKALKKCGVLEKYREMFQK